MEWLMVIVILSGIFGVGWFGIWMFGDLFDSFDARVSKKPVYVLLFGGSEQALGLEKLLKQKNISYYHTETAAASEVSADFTHLAALSLSDLDNLTISRMGEIMVKIPSRLIMCNEFINDEIFQKSGAPYFHKNEYSAEEILQRLFPLSKE